MKIVKLGFAVLLALITALTIIFWTPDTTFEDMNRKYGGGASQFIDLNGGDRLHYRDQGNRNKPALVFIHGTSASLHTWEPLIDNLERDYRLISFDLPGHGLTGARQDRTYSLDVMVESVWRLLDHLKIHSATLVGNSLGGAVAWASALDKPTRVKSLVLLAPSGAPKNSPAKSNIGFKILKTSIGQAIIKKISPRSIIKASLYQTVAVSEIVTEEMVDRYWELLRLEGNRQAMIDLANTARDPDEWQELSNIAVPTMIVWGEEDNVLPVTMIVTFDTEIENVNVIRLKNVGHLPMEEAVNAVSEAIVGFCGSIQC